MARIRSIHPAFFTDEEVVSVSFFARLLLVGVGTEADDKGVFVWKPLTLKMRLFPADDGDVGAALFELEQAELVKSYEHEGRKYGVIRNFRKHQRPKTPNDVHPMPEDLRIYAGLKASISEKPSPKRGGISEKRGVNESQFPPKGEISTVKQGQFPPKGEKPIQMEDGGEEVIVGEDNNSNELSSLSALTLDETDDYKNSCDFIVSKKFGKSKLRNPEVRNDWLNAGLSPNAVYSELTAVCENAAKPPVSWKYFNNHMLALASGSSDEAVDTAELANRMIISNVEKIKGEGLEPPPAMLETYNQIISQQKQGLLQ